MTTRLNLLPDPRFEPFHADLRARVSAAAAAIDHETFLDVFDALMRNVLHVGLAEAGAHEGTVWLADRARQELVGVYNTGANAERIAGAERHRQPLSRGLISMVYRSEQPFCENDVHHHQAQDRALDRKLGLLTCAMIAVPLYFAQEIRGVISCVQLKPADAPPADDPPGFTTESLRYAQFASAVLTRLIDHALLGATLGLARG
jgi:hypothetical protein